MEKIINSLIAIVVIASVLTGTVVLIAVMDKNERIARQNAEEARYEAMSAPDMLVGLLPPTHRGNIQPLYEVVAKEGDTCMKMLNASLKTCHHIMRQAGLETTRVKPGEVWHIVMGADYKLYVMMD